MRFIVFISPFLICGFFTEGKYVAVPKNKSPTQNGNSIKQQPNDQLPDLGQKPLSPSANNPEKKPFPAAQPQEKIPPGEKNQNLPMDLRGKQVANIDFGNLKIAEDPKCYHEVRRICKYLVDAKEHVNNLAVMDCIYNSEELLGYDCSNLLWNYKRWLTEGLFLLSLKLLYLLIQFMRSHR